MSCEIKVFDPEPRWHYAEYKLDDVLAQIEKSTIWELDGYGSKGSFDYFMGMIQTALEIKEWRARQEREFSLYKKLRAKFSPS